MESTIHDVMWLTVVVGLGRRWSLACELPTHKRSAHLVTTLDILSGHAGGNDGLSAHRGVQNWRADVTDSGTDLLAFWSHGGSACRCASLRPIQIDDGDPPRCLSYGNRRGLGQLARLLINSICRDAVGGLTTHVE